MAFRATAIRLSIILVWSSIEEITRSIFIEDDGAIYNLRGQRVDGNRLKKGIYIKKNKKIIVK